MKLEIKVHGTEADVERVERLMNAYGFDAEVRGPSDVERARKVRAATGEALERALAAEARSNRIRRGIARLRAEGSLLTGGVK